jgi:hypothetical protein
MASLYAVGITDPYVRELYRFLTEDHDSIHIFYIRQVTETRYELIFSERNTITPFPPSHYSMCYYLVEYAKGDQIIHIERQCEVDNPMDFIKSYSADEMIVYILAHR